MTKIGFIGIGMFADYTIKGMRNGGVNDVFYLSPRGKANAESLASSHNCEVLSSNQAVIDACDVIIMCVRPESYDEMAAEINVPAGKVIISAMAGITVEKLQSTLNVNDNIFRTLPVCCSEAGEGLVPVYPAGNDTVNNILKPLGKVLELAQEDEFNGATIASCINGSFYYLYDTMIEWFVKQGYDEEMAKAFVFENLSGTIAYAKLQSDKTLKQVGDSIATEGTYTLEGYKAMKDAGGLDGWNVGLDAIKKRFDDN
ncbi:MAG: pyrroline-5-carboxylate reductase family protein [Alphaproteobacteria bacterium]